MSNKHPQTNLEDTIDKVIKDNRRIVFSKNRKSVAAIIPYEDLKILQVAEELLFKAKIDSRLKSIETEGTISSEEALAYLENIRD